MKNTDFSKKYGIKNGLQCLQYQYEEHRKKFLEIDIKIPEVFILSSSVVVVYLSSLKQLPFLILLSAFVCFGITITSSIISLWKIREFHRQATLNISKSLGKFRIFEKQFSKDLNLDEYKKNINKLSKDAIEDISLSNLKRWSDFLQITSLWFFLMGLFQTIFAQFFNCGYIFIKIRVIIWVLFITFFIFYIIKKFFLEHSYNIIKQKELN